MKIDKNLILKLEDLSRLKLSDEERESMISNLSDMLKLVEKLKELPTDDVEPLIYVINEANVWRNDESETLISAEMAVKNAPEAQENFFSVPRVINLNNKYKLEQIDKDINLILENQKKLDKQIEGYKNEISKIDSTIAQVKNQKTVVREYYRDLGEKVDKMKKKEIDSFFHARYNN
jgi:aspartyl-tRNA(Asn)/glutamyl-tRNA(Gln) amidotransferase subunit C